MPPSTVVSTVVKVCPGMIIDDASYIEAQTCTSIDGNLDVDNGFSGSEISLPKLTLVSGMLKVLRHPQLTTLDFPMLKEVAHNLFLVENEELVSISLPELTTLGNHVKIMFSSKLTALDLSRLETVEGFFLVEGTALETLELLALSKVGGRNFAVKSNSELVSLKCPALKTVGSTVGDNFSVLQNERLVCVDFPVLDTVKTFGGVQTIEADLCYSLKCLPPLAC